MKSKKFLTRNVSIAILSIALCLLACVMTTAPTFAASVTPLPAPASASQITDPHDLETFLDGVMAAQLQDDHIPGATVSVVKDGKILFAKGYGFADIQQSEPVNAATTLFRIGSVSKLLTWTAVMQLAEEGKVNLQVDVNTYLKTFQLPATYPQPITLANLLTHTAGFEDSGISNYVPTAHDLQPLGQWLATHIPARVRAPGVLTSYSNYGATLAGYIVEQVSGMSFDQYIEQHIYAPLDMRQSTFRQPVPSQFAAHLSQGYTAVDGTYRADPFENIQYEPAGSMSSTAIDMAHFMIAHLQDGRYGNTRILQTATAEDMHKQHFAQDPRLPGMAYGFYEQSINNMHMIVHGGDTTLFHSLLALLPDAHVGVFVSYNSGGGSIARDTFLQAFLDRYFPAAKVSQTTTLAGFNQRADQISGSYLPTRRSYTTFQKLFNPLFTVNVSTAGAGHLVISGGGVQTFNAVEVAPWVFQQVDGSLTVIFHPGSGGTTMLVNSAPFEAFTRAAWYDTPTFHFLLLLVCLLLFLSAVLFWPLGFLRRARLQREGKRLSGNPRSLLFHILTGTVSGLDLLFVAGLAFLLASNPASLEFSVPPMLLALLTLALISAVLTVGVVLSLVLVWWRHFWNSWQRIHYTLVALAALAFIGELAYWNLLGFRF
ncbi:MAG TPA: serine hydrolase domain-containing protein [Ktedonobacteraceae bacterium]|nr:serine hydrolase domain-containing protein [Ktedonobacteraceae bacterium]